MAASPCFARDLVVVYPSYSAGGVAIVEGRVTEYDDRDPPAIGDRKRDNFARALDLMSNEEQARREVTVQLDNREWRTTTDAEGYFHVEMTDFGQTAGWRTVTARTAKDVGEAGLLVVPQGNVHGLISDVDDTIQVTEVNSARRMLANTLLRNPLQRQVVVGMAEFYRELASENLQPDATPVFYLSASPRQLHESISAFLEYNKFPRGVLITKRMTNDASSEPIRDQFAYKTAKIEEIFARVPKIRFTLVGDDGEQDPEIFAALEKRFPERIDAIWIRQVNPNPKRARLPGQGVLNDRLAGNKTPR